MPGRHRRVRLEDLIEYQSRFRAQRRTALRELNRANLGAKIQVGAPGAVTRVSEMPDE